MSQRAVLCSDNPRVPKPVPIGNRIMTPYQAYQRQLDENCRHLVIKFPTQPGHKIRELLQEFNNDPHVVQELLQEHSFKHSSQNRQIQQIYLQRQKSSSNEQNKILKRGIASLYTKLREAELKIKDLQGKNEILSRENQFYKNRNQLLIQEKMSQEFDSNFHIY